MTTPTNIIQGHRQTLVNRLVARNPLLHFKPSDRGYRVDVCDLFAPQATLSADNGRNKSAGDVFRELIADWAKLITDETKKKWVEIELPEEPANLVGRLARMRKAADDLHNASGMHASFWAWPFVCIPRSGAKPLAAPLLFWRIETQLSGRLFRIRMLEGAPHHNFMLDAWLKHKRELSLDFSRLSDEADEWNDSTLAGRISQFAKAWTGCQNDVDAHNLHRLRKFSTDGKQLAILPCAAIGTAHFKYWALLNDLEQLIPKAADDGNLLHEFFHTTEATRQPGEAELPGETEKYLVEQSDVAQERAVWQTRQSNVMLLKGPPGTGKSQTIVNLIADALRQGKRTALVCHKQAALDVVEKRLAAKGLGHLTMKIINPLGQRRAVIQSVKDLQNSDGGEVSLPAIDDRQGLSAQISKLEKKCDNIAESRGRGECGHSMRGDFLGRMAKARKQADFYPFDPSHEQFTKVVRPHLPKDKDALSRGKKELEDFAEDYATCRFTDNLWQSCRCHSDEGADIAMRFDAIASQAEALDGKRDRLPATALSSLLFSDMMRKYARALFSGEKKDAAASLADLIRYTKAIFAEAKLATAPPIWKDIFQGKGGEIYRRYAEDAEHLGMVASINERLHGKLTAALNRHYGGKMRHWPMLLDALFCYFEYGNLPRHSVANFGRTRESLKEQIDRKREADASAVLCAFPGRQSAARILDDSRLLRLKKSQHGPASTIRDVCHADLGNFSKVFPVLLLNPDAMSQILPLEPGILDLAIVDEASQMFVADALPILYRAKSIVISGDNMQMPPDNIFALQNDEYVDSEEEDDETSPPPTKAAYYSEESALLDAATGWIPANSAACCELNVHYRSRPTELIAFSNHAFYGGKLQAAPDNGASPLTRPIEIFHVAGTFQDGVNETEAQAIIELLKRIWSIGSQLSVGVIVFNVRQATRLKDMLADECEHCPDFNDVYQRAANQTDDGEDAGFFVRSVEHVQGDERDIIILGATYQNSGNYGTLSHSEKGRRRLNVAVTRAKHRMYVVSSLDINRISNESDRPGGDNKGRERWYLWKFMQYARAVSDGDRDAAVAVLRSLNSQYAPRQTGLPPDSQFEIDVAEFLRAKGYEVDYQIGEGGFRIDLGVKPQGAPRYLCGVECDGRFWHDGWKARHNDIWRQDILEGKGWNIYRIWSDEWYSSPDKTQKNLLAHLEKLADDAD